MLQIENTKSSSIPTTATFLKQTTMKTGVKEPISEMKELILLNNQSNSTILAIQTWSEYQNTDELLDLDTNGRIIHYTKKCEVP